MILIALCLLCLLVLGALVATLMLSRDIRQLRDEQRAWQKRTGDEIALHGPTKAAIAAVLAASQDKPLRMEDFESELRALQERWGEIERMSETAREKLAKLLKEPADSDRR